MAVQCFAAPPATTLLAKISLAIAGPPCHPAVHPLAPHALPSPGARESLAGTIVGSLREALGFGASGAARLQRRERLRRRAQPKDSSAGDGEGKDPAKGKAVTASAAEAAVSMLKKAAARTREAAAPKTPSKEAAASTPKATRKAPSKAVAASSPKEASKAPSMAGAAASSPIEALKAVVASSSKEAPKAPSKVVASAPKVAPKVPSMAAASRTTKEVLKAPTKAAAVAEVKSKSATKEAPKAPSKAPAAGGKKTPGPLTQLVSLVPLIFGVLVGLFQSLPDIFAEAPKEETQGKAAAGFKALGYGGLRGALQGCKLQLIFADREPGASPPPPGESDAAQVLLRTGRTRRTVVLFATHFGDFNSWEVGQQLRAAIKQRRFGSAHIALVGIGTVEAGRKFAEYLDLPEGKFDFYADPTASCYKALKFGQGAFPEYKQELNPYLRVFFMLFGVGSPGTIRRVLSGYLGDSSLKPEEVAWIDDALRVGASQGRFPVNVLTRFPWEKPRPGIPYWGNLAELGSTVWDGRGFAEGGQRPFELATVRLQNMVSGIVEHWDELKPPSDDLLVQQGGAFVVDGQAEPLYFYRDKGILTYAPFSEVAVAAAGRTASPVPTSWWPFG